MIRLLARYFLWTLLLSEFWFLGCASSHKMMREALETRDYTHLMNLAKERLQQQPDDDYAWFMAAKAFQRRAQPDSALFYTNQANHLAPGNRTYRQELLAAKIIMGDALLQQGLPLQAATLFQSAVAMDSSHFLAWQRLGLSQRSSGQMDQAQISYLRAYRINPLADSLQKVLDHLDATHVQSNLLMKKGIDLFKQQNYADATETLNQALQSKPDNLAALYYFHLASGCSFLASSELATAAMAIDHFTQASSLRPEEPEPHFYLASAYAKNNKYDQKTIIQEYEQVIQLAPTSELAKEAKNRLDQLRAQ